MQLDTPPPLRQTDKTNFETLLRAARDGNLALVSAIRKEDRAAAALICAMQENDDNTISPVPFAVMANGNPYDLFEDPTA